MSDRKDGPGLEAVRGACGASWEATIFSSVGGRCADRTGGDAAQARPERGRDRSADRHKPAGARRRQERRPPQARRSADRTGANNRASLGGAWRR